MSNHIGKAVKHSPLQSAIICILLMICILSLQYNGYQLGKCNAEAVDRYLKDGQ